MGYNTKLILSSIIYSILSYILGVKCGLIFFPIIMIMALPLLYLWIEGSTND